MSIEIVEVDPNEMKRASLMNRAKNDNVRAMYQALFELKPGQAKAIVAEPGDDLGRIRTALQHCAARSGHGLRIVLDRMAGRVLFTLAEADSRPSRSVSTSSRTHQDAAEAARRRQLIRDAALDLIGKNPVLNAQDVVDVLMARGAVGGMARPGTAVSAVMRNMPEFERIGKSQFRFVGG